jgi:hypothetical protein
LPGQDLSAIQSCVLSAFGTNNEKQQQARMAHVVFHFVYAFAKQVLNQHQAQTGALSQ